MTVTHSTACFPFYIPFFTLLRKTHSRWDSETLPDIVTLGLYYSFDSSYYLSRPFCNCNTWTCMPRQTGTSCSYGLHKITFCNIQPVSGINTSLLSPVRFIQQMIHILFRIQRDIAFWFPLTHLSFLLGLSSFNFLFCLEFWYICINENWFRLMALTLLLSGSCDSVMALRQSATSTS